LGLRIKFSLDPARAIPHTAVMTQALEEQIAHLTRTVEDLSDVMAKQDSELRRLTSLVEHLAQRARARDTDGGGGFILGDERPPHY
jgi:SlyX protein